MRNFNVLWLVLAAALLLQSAEICLAQLSEAEEHVIAAVPQCQAVGQGSCVPTVLSLASISEHAVHSKSEFTKSLFKAAMTALQCLESTHRTEETEGADQASNTAESDHAEHEGHHEDACKESSLLTLSVSPLYLQAFTKSTFSCGTLNSTTCTSNPACILEVDGGSSVCTNNKNYVASALQETDEEVAADLQSLADTCAAAAGPTCGASTMNVTEAMLEQLEALFSLSGSTTDTEEDHADHEEGGHHDHGDEHHDDHSADSQVSGSSVSSTSKSDRSRESLGLRIASIFIVLIAGYLGSAAPVVFKSLIQRDSLLTIILQSVSAGVILCLALVHIATHAIEQLDGLDEINKAGGEDPHAGHNHRRLMSMATPTISTGATLATLQSVLSLPMDPLHTVNLARKLLAGDDGHDHGSVASLAGGEVAVEEEEEHKHAFPLGMCAVIFGFVLMMLFEHIAHVVHAYQAPDAICNHHHCDPHCAVHHHAGTDGDNDHACTDAANVKVAMDSEHGHDIKAKQIANLDSNTQDSVDSGSEKVSLFRERLFATLFEVGCVLHSFLIGMSLGVSLKLSDVRPLLIALCFHQGLEGLSLGTILVRAAFDMWKQIVMITVYALTCPVGIAVGIGVASSYDEGSIASRAVQGTFNGISAGILLYLAGCLLLGPTTSTSLRNMQPSARVVSFLSMCAGIAVMAVIAKWV